jgi:ankyrin repeat protein
MRWSPPLHEGARAGHKEVVKFLYESGADINAKQMEELEELSCGGPSMNLVKITR